MLTDEDIELLELIKQLTPEQRIACTETFSESLFLILLLHERLKKSLAALIKLRWNPLNQIK